MKEYICCPSQEDIEFSRKLSESFKNNSEFTKRVLNHDSRIATIHSWAEDNNISFNENSEIVMEHFVNEAKSYKRFIKLYLRHKALFDRSPSNIAVPCGGGKEYTPISLLGERGRQILASIPQESNGSD